MKELPLESPVGVDCVSLGVLGVGEEDEILGCRVPCLDASGETRSR